MVRNLQRDAVRILVVGRQGSGKGEQCRRLAETFDLDHISTGDLLRAAVRDFTPLGPSVADHLLRGELVPDDIVSGVVAERLTASTARGQGAVLDGYPRTVKQGQRLRELLAPADIDLAIHLDVPRSTAVERIQNRRVCRSCGRAGRSTTTCRHCGGPTEHRADDWPAAIGRRMSEHARDSAPLLEWLADVARVVTIDGRDEPDAVGGRIADAVQDHLALVEVVTERSDETVLADW